MFTKPSVFKKFIRHLSWRAFNHVENNGNCAFDTNGERIFIKGFFSQLSPAGGIIFDIGANIGRYSTMLLANAEEYQKNLLLHVFEPTTSCFKELEASFSSPTKNPSIYLNNFGLSDIETEAQIFYDKEKSGLASLYKRNLDCYSIQLDACENILLKRACDYIEEHAIDHIDFVKIDVEGHELKCFEGFGKYMNPDFIDFIQFEYGGANLDSHTSLLELYSFLSSRGFAIGKVMPKGIELRSYSPYMENFMYSNYVAISKDKVKS